MTDLEIVKLCAEAMGYSRTDERTSDGYLWAFRDGLWKWYWPFDVPEQVMDMMLAFDIRIGHDYVALFYPEYAKPNISNLSSIATYDFKGRSEIPRAICMAVAEMQKRVRGLNAKTA